MSVGREILSSLLGKEVWLVVGGGVLGTATNAELGVRALRTLCCRVNLHVHYRTLINIWSFFVYVHVIITMYNTAPLQSTFHTVTLMSIYHFSVAPMDMK